MLGVEAAFKKLVGVERQPGRPQIPGEQESRGMVGGGGISTWIAADAVLSCAWVEDSKKLAGVERHPGRPHMPVVHESRGTVGGGGISASVAAETGGWWSR